MNYLDTDFNDPKQVVKLVKEIKSTEGEDRAKAIKHGLANLETTLYNNQTLYLYEKSPKGVDFFVEDKNYVNSAMEFFKLFPNNGTIEDQKLNARFIEILKKSKSAGSLEWLSKLVRNGSNKKEILKRTKMDVKLLHVLLQVTKCECKNRNEMFESVNNELFDLHCELYELMCGMNGKDQNLKKNGQGCKLM